MEIQRRLFIYAIGIGLVLIFSALSPFIAQADVEIFNYRGHGEDQSAVLQWETGNELHVSGFLILRSDSQSGDFLPVGDFIPGTGDISGSSYVKTDTNLVNGIGYWYRLDGYDDKGISSEYGPIQVIAGVFATPTLTATRTETVSTSNSTPTPTQTRTPTRTPTQPPTRTPRRTPTRTSPAVFSSSTPVFRASSTNQSLNPIIQNTSTPMDGFLSGTIEGDLQISQTVTTTATLLPVPEITLQFPTAPAEAPKQQPSSLADDPAVQNGRKTGLTIEKVILLGFIMSIWIFLGGWFYFSSRRLE